MKKDIKHLSLRINVDLLRQFEYTARYEDRSMNSLLLTMIRKHIAQFEKEHGPIQLSDES